MVKREAALRGDLRCGDFEFALPADASGKRELTLTWYQEPGRGGNGRGCQVAEVWLTKKR